MNEKGSRHFNVGYRKNLQHIMSVEDSASEVLEIYYVDALSLPETNTKPELHAFCERLAVVF